MRTDAVTDDAADILRSAEKRADENRKVEPATPYSETLRFPETAWRGDFADYRQAMRDTTEASDVFHFAAFWAAAAVCLGRRAYMFTGERIFPNFYGVLFGTTGDKKTTAQRQIINTGILPTEIQIIRNLGSTEGLADKLRRSDESDVVALMSWEEITSLFARGRWNGSTILEFITECFDCPPEWGVAYRREPIRIVAPTPTILAGTTPEWFWKNARADDFYGGFGNRFLYFTGQKKAANPSPKEPDSATLRRLRAALARLNGIQPIQAQFSPIATKLWETFYIGWEAKDRSGLYGAATKRIHVYVRKLAITYAALEGTLPEITIDQLKASIAVGLYCAECARVLVEARSASIRPEGEIEQRILDWVRNHDVAKKRYMQQTLSKVAGSCEVFNRAIAALQKAEAIEILGGQVFLAR